MLILNPRTILPQCITILRYIYLYIYRIVRKNSNSYFFNFIFQ